MTLTRKWVPQTGAPRPTRPEDAEKRLIIATCETFIADILKPRFLPRITPTEWNYVVDIHGAWAGGRYRFIQRYRSGRADNFGEEFNAPFTRIDRIAPNRFDIYWMRHTEKWWRLYRDQTLADALQIIENDELLNPI